MPKLNKRVIDAAKTQDRDYILWDDALPGFGVRILPSGKRSFCLQYRSQGRSRRLTLGSYGVLMVDQARRMAREHLVAVDHGGDPAEDRAMALRNPTLSQFSELYLERYARVHKRPSSVTADETRLRKHILPALGRRRVADIARQDVLRLHQKMSELPGAANRCVSLLHAMLNVAADWGYRVPGSNPATRIKRYRENPRERYLNPEELARLGDTLRELEERELERPEVIAAVRLLIFTGARRSEILNARWRDLKLQDEVVADSGQTTRAGWLVIPESKTGSKRIPLNAPALEVLDRLDRRSEWILPNRRGDAPVRISNPWKRIREHAGVPDLRVHDLRHSFASVGVGAGFGLYVVGKLLGHRVAATTQRYSHLADDPLRQATEAIGSRISAAMNGAPAEVRRLPHKG